MGLDNGIYIEDNEKIDNILNKVDPLEVCYWRKCYNIRQDIIELLDDKQFCELTDTGKICLSIDQIKEILNLFKKYNKNTWLYLGFCGAEWTWEEMKSTIKDDIKNLKHLIRLMKKYDIDVYFYDSY